MPTPNRVSFTTSSEPTGAAVPQARKPTEDEVFIQIACAVSASGNVEVYALQRNGVVARYYPAEEHLGGTNYACWKRLTNYRR